MVRAMTKKQYRTLGFIIRFLAVAVTGLVTRGKLLPFVTIIVLFTVSNSLYSIGEELE